MSITALAAVFKLEHPALTSAHQAVLVSLAWHFNDDEGVARPKGETIASESRCHRVTVVRILRELKQWGLIAPQGTTARGVVRYALSIDGLQAQPDCSARLHRQDSDSSPRLHQVLHTATPGVAHGYPISNRKTLKEEERAFARDARCAEEDNGRTKTLTAAPKLNGNGHGLTDAQHEQLARVAMQSFDTLGLFVAIPEVQVDFVLRAQALGLSLDGVNVPLFLWNFKQTIKQLRRAQ